MNDPFDDPDPLPVITWAPPDRPCEICGPPTPLLADGRRIHALGCEQPTDFQAKETHQ